MKRFMTTADAAKRTAPHAGSQRSERAKSPIAVWTSCRRVSTLRALLQDLGAGPVDRAAEPFAERGRRVSQLTARLLRGDPPLVVVDRGDAGRQLGHPPRRVGERDLRGADRLHEPQRKMTL